MAVCWHWRLPWRVALPWFVLMVNAHGWQALTALAAPPDGLLADHQLSLLPRLIKLAPVTLPLGLFGAVRAIRSALVDESDTHETIGGSFWVIWLASRRAGPDVLAQPDRAVPSTCSCWSRLACWPRRRSPTSPTAGYRCASLIAVAPATAMSITWWASADLSEAVDDLIHGRADSATALGLHLALDLVVASVLIIRALNRWARRRDDRQRWILAVFLLVVMAVTIVIGLREVLFRHSETRALAFAPHDDSASQPRRAVSGGCRCQSVLARSGRRRSSSWPSIALARRAPSIHPQDSPAPVTSARSECDRRAIFSLPDGHRLIVLAGTGQRLSSADQSKLGLEAIHPGRSGILDAYATARDRPRCGDELSAQLVPAPHRLDPTPDIWYTHRARNEPDRVPKEVGIRARILTMEQEPGMEATDDDS